MAMTEEQRKAQSERMKKMQAEKKAQKAAAEKAEASTKEVNTPVAEKPAEAAETAKIDAEKEAMKAELEAMRKQLADMQKAMATPTAPQTIVVQNDTQKVHFLYMAEVADDNQFLVGDNGMYGRIVGKVGEFFVPKSDLSRVMDSMFVFFLKKRWIIVLDGLTEDERIAYDVNYSDGEVLDKNSFMRAIDLGDKIIDIYPELCDSHKEMVGKMFYEAWSKRDLRITRELVTKLSGLTEKGIPNAFRTIIEEMNAEDAQG